MVAVAELFVQTAKQSDEAELVRRELRLARGSAWYDDGTVSADTSMASSVCSSHFVPDTLPDSVTEAPVALPDRAAEEKVVVPPQTSVVKVRE